jgi:3-phosphoshikimate 1-carboxyvinyltransferase
MQVASAQVKSAVLLAGLRARGRTTVIEPATTRDHTERMLRAFGAEVVRDGAAVSLDGGQPLRGTSIDVPGDFSSAAFFLVGGAIGAAGTAGLTLRNVGLNPTRSALLQILSAMGADLHVRPHPAEGGEPTGDITVRPSALRGVSVPRELVPIAIDEFPVFFVAAACADGVSELAGAEELRVKESDRLAVMAEGLAALGVEHELRPGGIRIVGRPPAAGPAFRGGVVDSHGDHRVAMAFAMASLRAAAPIDIADTANVATSFPGFAELARAAGLALEEP